MLVGAVPYQYIRLSCMLIKGGTLHSHFFPLYVIYLFVIFTKNVSLIHNSHGQNFKFLINLKNYTEENTACIKLIERII